MLVGEGFVVWVVACWCDVVVVVCCFVGAVLVLVVWLFVCGWFGVCVRAFWIAAIPNSFRKGVWCCFGWGCCCVTCSYSAVLLAEFPWRCCSALSWV